MPSCPHQKNYGRPAEATASRTLEVRGRRMKFGQKPSTSSFDAKHVSGLVFRNCRVNYKSDTFQCFLNRLRFRKKYTPVNFRLRQKCSFPSLFLADKYVPKPAATFILRWRTIINRSFAHMRVAGKARSYNRKDKRAAIISICEFCAA